MKHNRWLLFYFLIAIVALLYGCGSSMSSDGSKTGDADSVGEAAVKIGINRCLSCHIESIADQDSKFTDAYTNWMQGPHGNFNKSVSHVKSDYSDFAVDAGTYNAGNSLEYIGFPDFDYLSDDSCLNCHGPSNLDNQAIASLPLVGYISNIFIDWSRQTQVARPVVGCESCHGGGSMHQIDPGLLPSFNPDMATCGNCHNVTFDHLAYHPIGAGGVGNPGILEAVSNSPHSRSINSHVLEDEASEVNSRCSKCHTDEGARKYKAYDEETYAALKTTFDTLPALSGDAVTAVQCRTCHDAHNPDEYLEAVTGNKSAQYNTCTNCHQLTNAANSATVEPYHYPVTDGHPGANGHGAWNEIIVDTHFDQNVAGIQGYNVKANDIDACSSCHNVHQSDNAINNQWAHSGHGGEILIVKEAALAINAAADLPAIALDDTTAAAWNHYDFKDVSRQPCQRCHTATGSANFHSDPVNYDATANDFSYLALDQKEMLYCSGCHDADGASTGKVRAASDTVVNIMIGAEIYDNATISDDSTAQGIVNMRIDAMDSTEINGSKVCLSCHAGRMALAIEVEAKYGDDNSLDGDSSGSGSHYLDSTGVLYRTGAYEFPNVSYENPAYFKHIAIGTASVDGGGEIIAENTGDNGPCAGCHLPEDAVNKLADHTLKITEDTDGDGNDDTIRSNVKAVCDTCHTPGGSYELTFEALEHEKDGFNDALKAMKFFITNNYLSAPIGLQDSYPYAYYGPDGSQFNTADDNWSTDFGVNDKSAYGVAYNYVMLAHEPGAFAHNRYYAKRIIFDAINFMQDGVLDGVIDLSAYPKAAAWYQGEDIDTTDDDTIVRP